MEKVRELSVPHHAQENIWYCGPATLQMFLECYGIELSQKQLANRSRTTEKDGTPASGMIRAIKLSGIPFRTKSNATYGDIVGALKQRKPTIVAYLVPGDEEPHYTIPIRMSSRYIWLQDVWMGPGFRMTRPEFRPRWVHQGRWILIPKNAPHDL